MISFVNSHIAWLSLTFDFFPVQFLLVPYRKWTVALWYVNSSFLKKICFYSSNNNLLTFYRFFRLMFDVESIASGGLDVCAIN